MKLRFLLPALLLLATSGRAEEAPKAAPDIFKPDWLAGYLPPALLVVKPAASEDDRVRQKFLDALEQVRLAKPVRLDDFPSDQVAPKRTSRAPRDGPPQKSADAGFLVLLSQKGKVAALYVAYTTDPDWARRCAVDIANWTFAPAQYKGRAVPVLLCVRDAVERSVQFNSR